MVDFFLQYPRLLLATYKSATNNNHRKIVLLLKICFALAFVVLILGLLVLLYFRKETYPDTYSILRYAIYTLAILIVSSTIVAISYEENFALEKNDELILNQERKVAEHPNEPKLAWDLARIKLESYLNRNLSQVKSIFTLSVFVMVVGFGLIIYGSIMVFQDPKNLNRSIVVAISGLIVNFIGATFLIVYKSVMEQAKEYVTVLERINAVGMSVQIIETIKDSHAQIKEETKAELSKKLIDLYTIKSNS